MQKWNLLKKTAPCILSLAVAATTFPTAVMASDLDAAVVSEAEAGDTEDFSTEETAEDTEAVAEEAIEDAADITEEAAEDAAVPEAAADETEDIQQEDTAEEADPFSTGEEDFTEGDEVAEAFSDSDQLTGEYQYVYAGLTWGEYWAAEGVYAAGDTSSSEEKDSHSEFDTGAFDTVTRATTNHGLHRGSYQCMATIDTEDGKKYELAGWSSDGKQMILTDGTQLSYSKGTITNADGTTSKLSSYDSDMLTAFQDTVKAVEEKEAKLQYEYEKLNTLQSTLVSQQTEAQTLISSKEAQIAEIQDQITDNANLLADLKAKAEEAKRLQEEQAAAAAAAAAAAKKNNSGSSSSNGSSSSRPASSGNVVSGSGYFTHPCPGMTYQSSYFGEVRSFDSRPHKGNDYAAPTGTPTYAAAAGTVITAGWSNSAGNWVVISHGNGLVTKYMHHSSICVSAGQRVAKGQQIGYVGSTGYSTGAHLHFQVELNGTPVNPNNYM